MPTPAPRQLCPHLPLALLAVVLLSACERTLYLMPTPEPMRGEQHDLFAGTPTAQRNNEVEFLYATTRRRSFYIGTLYYGEHRSDTLRLGTAKLRIGHEEMAWGTLLEAVASGADTRRLELTLHDIGLDEALPAHESAEEPLSRDLQNFMDRLNAAVLQSPAEDLTLFIDGGAGSFYLAAAEAAQFRFFGGQRTPVVLFAWPTGKPLPGETEPDLTRVLELVVSHSVARRIHVVGWGAGARLAAAALSALEPRAESTPQGRLGRLYLADGQDSLTPLDFPLERLLSQFEQITLAGRFDDPALQAPAGTADIAPDPRWQGLQPAVVSGALTLLHLDPGVLGAQAMPSGAWQEDPWLTTDTIAALGAGLTPAERGLVHFRSEGGLPVWYVNWAYLRTAGAALTTAYRREGPEE